MLTNNIPNKSKKDTTILSMRGVINSIKSIVSENIYIHPYIHIYVDNTYKCAYGLPFVVFKYCQEALLLGSKVTTIRLNVKINENVKLKIPITNPAVGRLMQKQALPIFSNTKAKKK